MAARACIGPGRLISPSGRSIDIRLCQADSCPSPKPLVFSLRTSPRSRFAGLGGAEAELGEVADAGLVGVLRRAVVEVEQGGPDVGAELPGLEDVAVALGDGVLAVGGDGHLVGVVTVLDLGLQEVLAPVKPLDLLLDLRLPALDADGVLEVRGPGGEDRHPCGVSLREPSGGAAALPLRPDRALSGVGGRSGGRATARPGGRWCGAEAGPRVRAVGE